MAFSGHMLDCRLFTHTHVNMRLCAQGESSIYIAEQGSCAEALHILCNQGKVQQEAGDRMGWARALLTGASSIEASVQWLGKKLSPMGSLQ